MRPRALLLCVPLLWAAAQACSLNKEATGAGAGYGGGFEAGVDHAVEAPTGDGQAGAGGTGAGGAAGTGGVSGTGGMPDAGGTGGVSPTLCIDCPAHQCGLDEACTLLAGSGGAGAQDGGADTGVDASSDAEAGSDAGADASADASGGPDGGSDAGADAGAPRAVCLPRCDLAAPSCPTGFSCRALGAAAPVCYPDAPAECVAAQPDGAGCSGDFQCSSGHCDNGHCCASGVCCAASTDCPGSTVTCTDPANCQGTRSGQVCQSNQCVSGSEDDDSACAAGMGAKTCGNYADVACTGAVTQGTPSCATSCSGDSGCVAPATCNLGHCCPTGTFDFDNDPTTCECSSTPPVGQGTSCTSAIDLGSLSDVGQSVTVQANLLPDRDVWYQFNAVDTPDTSCDAFNVHVHFTTNPGNGYRFTVLRGTCNTPASCSAGTDYNWQTNFRQTIGGTLAGECPCTAPGAPQQTNVSTCTDDSAEFFVHVALDPSFTPTSCDEFVLEASNG